jgi:hypothetical protein
MLELSPPLPILLLVRVAELSGLNTIIVLNKVWNRISDSLQRVFLKINCIEIIISYITLIAKPLNGVYQIIPLNEASITISITGSFNMVGEA